MGIDGAACHRNQTDASISKQPWVLGGLLQTLSKSLL